MSEIFERKGIVIIFFIFLNFMKTFKVLHSESNLVKILWERNLRFGGIS
jgi:hypothetical protein